MLKTISSPANYEISLKTTWNSIFLTLEAKLAFLQLRKAFTKASILYHFDLKRYIWIKIDAFNYVIGDIFS